MRRVLLYERIPDNKCKRKKLESCILPLPLKKMDPYKEWNGSQNFWAKGQWGTFQWLGQAGNTQPYWPIPRRGTNTAYLPGNAVGSVQHCLWVLSIKKVSQWQENTLYDISALCFMSLDMFQRLLVYSIRELE